MAMALLAGFAQGSIQMKGNAVKHIQEGNTARLKQVTIELLQPNGEIIGKIDNMNFLDESESDGSSIREMSQEIEVEDYFENETDFSMSKKKTGRINLTKLSSALKDQQKQEKEKERASKKGAKEKPPAKLGLGSTPAKEKPTPRSGLGSKETTPAKGKEAAVPIRTSQRLTLRTPATEQVPAALATHTMPCYVCLKLSTVPTMPATPVTPILDQQVRGNDEATFPTATQPGHFLTQNLRINPSTGLSYTLEAEKKAIRELMERKRKATGNKDLEEEESSEDQEEAGGDPSPKKRRTSHDLVPKKRVGGGAMKSR